MFELEIKKMKTQSHTFPPSVSYDSVFQNKATCFLAYGLLIITGSSNSCDFAIPEENELATLM